MPCLKEMSGPKKIFSCSRCFWVRTLVFLLCFSDTHAWSPNQKGFQPGTARRKELLSPFLPSNSKLPQVSSPSQPVTAKNMLKNPGNPRVNSKEVTRKSKVKLSHSVLADCDTLPSFRTAHGLLSPETVMRLEELTSQEERSEALSSFLNTYRKSGPLSCLPMLSDPDILPHLTEALRDIAA